MHAQNSLEITNLHAFVFTAGHQQRSRNATSKNYPRNIPGTFQEHPKNAPRTSQERPRNDPGMSFEHYKKCNKNKITGMSQEHPPGSALRGPYPACLSGPTMPHTATTVRQSPTFDAEDQEAREGLGYKVQFRHAFVHGRPPGTSQERPRNVPATPQERPKNTPGTPQEHFRNATRENAQEKS